MPQRSARHQCADPATIARDARANPSLLAKAPIGLIGEVLGGTDWLGGPGDDGAVVEDRGSCLVVGGEAIFPPFVAADPFGAGVAAVLTNVNDLAAMGATPLALVDTFAGTEPVARRALEGMRWASELYDVPIVGGHLTVRDAAPALSAFGLGRTDHTLSARRAAAGQTLMLACCLDGRMRADFPFFPSFDERGTRLAGDVRLLAELADRGLVAAAKDVSMAGLLGSLGMLLEYGRLGVTVDLDAVPVPADVPLTRWLSCFPCFSFLLCVPRGAEDACAEAFGDRDLVAQAIGVLDGTGVLRVSTGRESAPVFDLTAESVTGLPTHSPRPAR
ncbi:MAG: AIR synthase related protein [Streptosporangiaceae bacterium]